MNVRMNLWQSSVGGKSRSRCQGPERASAFASSMSWGMSAPERPISLTIRQIGIATSLKVTVESFFITIQSPIATTSRSRTLSYGPIRQLSEIPGKFNRSQAKQRICSVRLRFAQRVCSTMLGAYRHFLFWSQVLFVSVCRRVEETVWVSALGASPVSETYTH